MSSLVDTRFYPNSGVARATVGMFFLAGTSGFTQPEEITSTGSLQLLNFVDDHLSNEAKRRRVEADIQSPPLDLSHRIK